MANTFTYQGREFGLSLIKEGSKLHRVVINDGGLEFPFAQGGYDKVAEFLVDEYGGNKETALEVLNAAQTLEGLEVAGAPASVSPEKGGKNKSARKPKTEKEPKPKKEKVEKAPKEVVVQSFNLAGGTVKEKKIQVKTILPDQKPESTEDVMLDDVYALHIDIYSKKNRTSALYVVKEGADVATYPESVQEAVISGVSLMDVIYAYAEKKDMSFAQADKYIKIKRGLLPEPTPKAPKVKKEKTPKAETTEQGATDVESTTAE